MPDILISAFLIKLKMLLLINISIILMKKKESLNLKMGLVGKYQDWMG